jgi:hypothetical protein
MDWDDYIKVDFDLNTLRLSFRLGVPIINQLVGRTPSQSIKDTRYNQIEAHDFRLDSIGTDGLRIHASVRWKRFTDKPFGGTFKTGETDCDSLVLVNAFVNPSHEVAVPSPTVLGTHCSNSGFDLLEVFDILTKTIGFIVSGGKAAPGIFDIFAGFGSLLYNFDVLLIDARQIYQSDPVQYSLATEDRTRYVKELRDLPSINASVFLSQIRYEPKGVWFDFQFEFSVRKNAEWLTYLFRTPSPAHLEVYLQRVKDHSEWLLNHVGLSNYWQEIYGAALNDTHTNQGHAFLQRVRDHSEWLLRHNGAGHFWQDIHRSAMGDAGE